MVGGCAHPPMPLALLGQVEYHRPPDCFRETMVPLNA